MTTRNYWIVVYPPGYRPIFDKADRHLTARSLLAARHLAASNVRRGGTWEICAGRFGPVVATGGLPAKEAQP